MHRTTPLHLIGPTGFADNVEHKLKAYTLNLLDAQSVDFAILARLFAKFRCSRLFRKWPPACRLTPFRTTAP